MVKTTSEIEKIRQSCRIVAGVLNNIVKYLKPGVETGELDAIIEDYIKSRNAEPAFKGYMVNKNVFPCEFLYFD